MYLSGEETPVEIESLGHPIQIPGESSSSEANSSEVSQGNLTEKNSSESSNSDLESSTSDSSLKKLRRKKSTKKRKTKNLAERKNLQSSEDDNSVMDEDFPMEQSVNNSSDGEEGSSYSDNFFEESRSSENDSEYEVEKILSKSTGPKVSFSSVNPSHDTGDPLQGQMGWMEETYMGARRKSQTLQETFGRVQREGEKEQKEEENSLWRWTADQN
jgi:hypothetical protein